MMRDALDNLKFRSNAIKRGTRAMLWTTLLVSWTIIASVIAVLLMQPRQVLANQRDYTGWGLPEGAKARLGKGTITDIQLSRDGTRLAVASSAGVWLYDVRTGDEIALITENTALIGQVAFSPDGAALATADGDNTCHVWDVESQKRLSTFKMPDYWIKTLAFMEDGKTLVGEGIIDKRSSPLLSDDVWRWDVPKVWMWDASSGKQLDTFTTELPRFNPMKDARTSVMVKAFANNERVIFVFENKDETISVKDGRTNRGILLLPKPKWEVRAFSFTSDGKVLGVATDRSVYLWDLETGEQVLTFPKRVANFSGHASILVFSQDKKTLAVAGLDDIEIWNMDTRSRVATLKNTEGGLWQFVLSTDGTTVITVNHHGTVDLWSATTGKHERTLTTGYTNRFRTLAFSPDGEIIASSTGSKVHLWDTGTCTEKFRIQLPGRVEKANKKIEPWSSRAAVPMERGTEIIDLVFSEYDTPLAALGSTTTLSAFTVSGKVEMWDVISEAYDAGYTLREMPRRVVYGPLTDDLPIVPSPRTSAIHHIYATLFESSGQACHPAAFSPNGEKLVFKNQDDIMEIIDALTGRSLCTLPVPVPYWNSALTFPLAFTQDSEVLAVGKGTDVHLSNTDTGEIFATFSVPRKNLNLMDKLLERFESRGSDTSIHAVAAARVRKSTIIAANAGNTIYVSYITQRRPILELKGHANTVCKLAFSPDATVLASGDIDGTIHLWSLPAGHKIATFNPYVGPVKELVFSPDGKTFASTNLHSRFAGTILLWDVPVQ